MKKMFRYETYLGAIGIAESDGAITNLGSPQRENLSTPFRRRHRPK